MFFLIQLKHYYSGFINCTGIEKKHHMLTFFSIVKIQHFFFFLSIYIDTRTLNVTNIVLIYYSFSVFFGVEKQNYVYKACSNVRVICF